MPEASGPSDTHAVTALLARLSRGDHGAFADLLPLVYHELKAVAGRQLGREDSGHTLTPTALVHEVYFRLVGQREPHFQDREHFFGVAARAMRRLLVDHARGRRRLKRDAALNVELAPDLAAEYDEPEEILALDDALRRLTVIDERQARVVELRYFMGLDLDETARTLGVSTATVKRDWVLARAFLKEALSSS